MVVAQMNSFRKVCNNCWKSYLTLNPHSKFCSEKCRINSRTKTITEKRANTFVTRICKWCEESFTTNNKKLLHCSAECSKNHHNAGTHLTRAIFLAKKVKKPKEVIIFTRVCRWCEKEFTTDHKQLWHCSKQCRRERHNAGNNITKAQHLIKPRKERGPSIYHQIRRKNIDLEQLLADYKDIPEATAWIKANSDKVAWRERVDSVLSAANFISDDGILESFMFQSNTPGCRHISLREAE